MTVAQYKLKVSKTYYAMDKRSIKGNDTYFTLVKSKHNDNEVEWQSIILVNITCWRSGLPTCLHQKKARPCPKKIQVTVSRHILIHIKYHMHNQTQNGHWNSSETLIQYCNTFQSLEAFSFAVIALTVVLIICFLSIISIIVVSTTVKSFQYSVHTAWL